MKSLIVSLSLTAIVILATVIFSKQGLLDLRRFQKQVSEVRDVVAQVENENKKLKAELDSVSNPSAESLERKMREVLGWVKPGEIVYLEAK